MGPLVGGRMEEVQRSRSLFGPDYLRLAALAIVAIAVHGWLVAHTAVTARDSLGFARQATCIKNPSAAPPNEDGQLKSARDHIREAEHPPGFALAVLATDAVLHRITDRAPLDRLLLACQIANALAAILLVVPTYLIGRMLFSRNVGFAAALMFQVLPVPARITSDGLTEGTYLLAASVAIVLGVRAVRRPRISGFLLCGLATGASYLVRPEGLMIAAGPGVVALWLGFKRVWPRDATLGRLTALAVGVALVSVPYMLLIGKITNKPGGQDLLNPIGPSRPAYFGLEDTRLAVIGSPLFAVWWNDEKDAGKSYELWVIQGVCKEAMKSANYVLWPLAGFAVFALRRRFATEPGLWVLLVLLACNFLLLIYLAARRTYLSERHTMLLTLFACQFAAAGLPLLAAGIAQLLPRMERLGVRVTAASLLVALVASSLPFALRTMHPQREGHKHAGRWLASRITDKDALVDPFCWAEWYAGRTLYRTTWNPPDWYNTYVIWENKSNRPHSRLPIYQHAKEVKEAVERAGKRPVYHWPEDVPWQEAAIQVWKVDINPLVLTRDAMTTLALIQIAQ